MTILLALIVLPGISAAPAADLIASLPGITYKPNFLQYSGYLKASNKSRFHYWFVLSQHSPTRDPVLLWLNGGPGCSSLLGLMTENGPFRATNFGNNLVENVYSWNKVANVLYIESPAGIGFSYATDGNTNSSDDKTAMENYYALVDFFTYKFPEMRSHDFYISGESYAGIYLPMLGKLIIEDDTNFPNFKGVAIGNGVLDYPLSVNTYFPFLYNHGLVSEKYFLKFNKAFYGEYNLYKTCYMPSNVLLDATKPTGAFYSRIFKKFNIDIDKLIEKFSIENHMELKEPVGGAKIPLCAQSNSSTVYLNRPDVRKALHIPSFVGPWGECSNINYQMQYLNMYPQIQSIMKAKKKLLIYNGDVDTVCNALGGENFVARLNATLLHPKSIWTYATDIPDTAGLATLYQGVDFLTVRGSGHMVPTDKPREALQMIANFLWGRSYSSPTGLNLSPQPPLGGYCNQMVLSSSLFNGPVKAASLCAQGACTNTPNGATCSCSYGYTGKLCNQCKKTDMGNPKTVQIKLCASYPTPQTKLHGLPFGCPQTYTCVPYQYRCVTTLSCNYPIGYCLPWAHIHSISPSIARKLKVLQNKTE